MPVNGRLPLTCAHAALTRSNPSQSLTSSIRTDEVTLFECRCETALQPPCGGGYVSTPCISPMPVDKEDDGERSRTVPFGQYVPGLPGRDFARHRSPAPPQRREPRSAAIAAEAHRGQGGGRALADP